MDEQTRTVLDAAAGEVLDMAERLIFVGERLHQLVSEGDEPEAPQYGPGEDQGKWMRGAKRELAGLIREIEGPNPPPPSPSITGIRDKPPALSSRTASPFPARPFRTG